MDFSKKVWNKNIKNYQKIKDMPFNKELMEGSLDKNKFAYYIEQDAHYLKYYSKVLAIISSKIDDTNNAIAFLKSSINSYIVRELFNFKNTNKITTANLGYTSFLINTAHTESVEVAASAILPCFWIYNEIGKYIKENAVTKNNPYKKWIDTYADEEFSKSTYNMISIIDNMYLKASKTNKDKMIKAFNTAFIWEYRFWNDAYNLEVFNKI